MKYLKTFEYSNDLRNLIPKKYYAKKEADNTWSIFFGDPNSHAESIPQHYNSESQQKIDKEVNRLNSNAKIGS